MLNQINIGPLNCFFFVKFFILYLFAVKYNVFVRKETFESAQNYLKLRSKRSYMNCIHTKTNQTRMHFVSPLLKAFWQLSEN